MVSAVWNGWSQMVLRIDERVRESSQDNAVQEQRSALLTLPRFSSFQLKVCFAELRNHASESVIFIQAMSQSFSQLMVKTESSAVVGSAR